MSELACHARPPQALCFAARFWRARAGARARRAAVDSLLASTNLQVAPDESSPEAGPDESSPEAGPNEPLSLDQPG
jgi:hypothetical protein